MIVDTNQKTPVNSGNETKMASGLISFMPMIRQNDGAAFF
jgi:hypothetical protein